MTKESESESKYKSFEIKHLSPDLVFIESKLAAGSSKGYELIAALMNLANTQEILWITPLTVSKHIGKFGIANYTKGLIVKVQPKE